ncbi:MAG: hypothetical protein LH618_03360 [Saprospiraceae bacterium]|nr:hypothetical protein [Saprospiraceae bacterium]
MGALAERKLEFIRAVSEIEDEKTLLALMEAYWQITAFEKTNGKSIKPIRPQFDAEAIRRRRVQVGHDKARIMRLIQEMDVQEPIEQLLAQLTK